MLRPAHALQGVAMASNNTASRRLFLQTTCGTFSAAWLTLHWGEVVAAARNAHQAAQSPAALPVSFLTQTEAAIVEAVAAQIIPSDSTPGAREAGVVYFIDRALATFFAHMAQHFRSQLSAFHRDCRKRYPEVESFPNLPSDRQIEWLRTIEHTPFFQSMQRLTVLGMFTMPAYGGNRDGLGWQLMGFVDQHVFEPPFGYYDRDYPGFVVEPPLSK